MEQEIQNSHGARPVNQVIQSMWWTRTSRLSIKNSLSSQADTTHRCRWRPSSRPISPTPADVPRSTFDVYMKKSTLGYPSRDKSRSHLKCGLFSRKGEVLAYVGRNQSLKDLKIELLGAQPFYTTMGLTQEVEVAWSHTTGGTAVAISLSFAPARALEVPSAERERERERERAREREVPSRERASEKEGEKEKERERSPATLA